jgi:hypothetical protein
MREYLDRNEAQQQEDGVNYIMRSFTVLFCSKHILSEVNQSVAGRRAKWQHGGDDSCIQNFSRKI